MNRRFLLSVFAAVAFAAFSGAGCGDGSTTDRDVENPADIQHDTVTDNGGSCTDECPEEGVKECSQGAPRQCTDLDDDGCLEWSIPAACDGGKVCSNGECVTGCADQECTAIGAKSCSDQGAVVECGDFDSDGCLQWGNQTTCESPLVCARGYCSTECMSECTAIGAKKCAANSVVTCGDYNSDGCLEWGGATACGDQYCSSGKCQDKCSDECTSIGSRQCETGGYVVCDEYDDDGCLEWGTVLFCGKDQVCSNGFCSAECTPGCTVDGARKCDVNSVVECGDYNDDGCLEWGSPIPCDDGLVCSGGNCAMQCSNECTVAMARQCDEAGAVVTCKDYNEDGCLEWGSPQQCDDGLVCSGGNCAISCSNDCEVKNDSQCVAGTQNKFRVCGDYNEDGCLEWGTAQQCEGSLVCSGGECASSCSNECDTVDALHCVTDASWAQCRDYNSDGCLEWGTAVYCESWEECADGKCAQMTPPATILIDEIMIDTTSSPDIDSFVELWGPAGTDLTGWRLVGVNGSSGDDYQVIDLAGKLGSDGRFVVAHPDSQASIHDMGDQFNANVDYQNGPDSVQLRYGTTVVDAIGYDTFAVDDHFAGEGTPVARPTANHSLARDLSHTDTDNNAADFTELAVPTPGAANQNVNEPPVADLVCPASGSLGTALTFDASNSDDPDGSLASFKFDFGDSTTPVTGTNTVVQHTFGSADTFTVTLTVTDDRGATDTASCQIVIGDDNAPTVDFIKPAADTQVTQGAAVNVIVNPTARPGRSIARVDLWADGVDTGMSDDSAPYEFTYTVPADYANNTSLTLQAKAVDNLGSVGFGSVRLLVRNDVPVASFTAVVSGDKQITVDASSSRDTETAVGDLLVRWDFENDGTWDTAWATEKVLQHTYPADGQYTVKMEVKDAIGQTASFTRDITLSSIQYVGGTVNTTTWTGTIVITGDVTVPSGQTLTVAAGTSVQFAFIDQNKDGVGDYDITINGTLIVEGTAAQPVLFTVYGTTERHSRAWNRIIINGTGSQVRNAIFEYADLAFEVRKDLLMEDSVIRYCREGLESASGGNSTLNRVTIRENTADGMVVTAGTVTADESLFAANGARGIYAYAGTMNLSDSEVSGNGASGIEFLRAGGGTIVRNLITGNAFEGVRVWTDTTSDPNPIINYNNITGNATTSALVVAPVSLSTTTDSSYYGTKSSAAWTNPAGTTILRILMSYSEYDYDYYNYENGYVKKDSASGVDMASSSTGVSRWFDSSAAAATSMVAVVSDSSSSYYGSTTVSKAAYMDPSAVREAAVITYSGVIDMRHNYFGVFPDVLSVVSLGSTTAANLHGFVGAAFDESWSKGIYYGGETITTPTTWMGTIYITGDLTFSGTTLSVQPGTQILFAPVDQDGNGIGDFDLNLSAATFTSGGTEASPVTFSSVGGVANGYQEVKAYGTAGTSDIDWTVFENGNTGLHIESGTHSLTSCTFQDNEVNGLWLRSNSGSDSVTVTGGTMRRNQKGVYADSFRNLAVDRVLVENNESDGIAVNASTTALAMTNSTVRNNAGNGVNLTNATFGINHCNIQYNDQSGVRYQGTAAGSLTNSNIKFNDREGVLLLNSGTSNPAPVINANNLYGNSLISGVTVATPSLTISTDSSYYGTKWSSAWSTPAGENISWIRVTYTEYDYDYYNYENGSVVVGSTSGTQVWSASTAQSARFTDIESYAAKSIYAGVSDSSSSYYGTTTVGTVMYRSSNVPTVTNQTELAAATDSGTVDCKGNYWGTFPDVQPRFSLGRTDAIDFQNFVGAEVSGAGPLP